MSEENATTEDSPISIRISAWAFVAFFAALGGLFAVTYFLLPVIQHLIFPSPAMGQGNIWLIRPELSTRIGACVLPAAVMAALLIRRMRRASWFFVTPPGVIVGKIIPKPAPWLLLFIYLPLVILVCGSAIAFYLLSWTRIGPTGIEQHLPWGVRKYGYQQIASLQQIPDGYRSDSLQKDGPWDNITFQDRRELDFGLDNEGLSAAELSEIETYLSGRSAMKWKFWNDARHEGP